MAPIPLPVGPFPHADVAAPPDNVWATTDRVGRWRDLIHEHFVALDIAPDRDATFDGAVRSTLLGGLAAAVVDSTAQDCVRTPGLARRDPETYLQIGLVAHGTAVLHQDGREALLRPGAYAVYETDRPFTWHFDGRWRLLVFTWRREDVGLGADASRAVTARPLGGDRLGAIVGRMLAEVVSAPPKVTDVGARRLGGELAELVGTVAGEALRRGEVLSPRGAAELRAQVETYVAEHLEDPDLGPESIAREHFVSTRQLHRAFADASTTVSRLVRRRRLEHARRELVDPKRAEHSVTEVALRSGFSDLASFSRAFKDLYQEPPSTFRRRGGA